MKRIQGKPVSGGYALGRLLVFQTEEIECEKIPIKPEDVIEEKNILLRSLARTRNQIKELLSSSVDDKVSDSYAIFEGYLEIITDKELENDLSKYIEKNLVNFDYALYQVSNQYVEDMMSLDDPYLRARAEDFKQIFRMIKKSSKETERDSDGLSATQSRPFILAAKEIGPADMQTIDTSLLLGIAVETGSKTSHAAIISRSLGIPMVSGIENIVKVLQSGDEAAIDGSSGVLVVSPDEAVSNEFRAKIAEAEADLNETKKYLDKEARTKDGTRITLFANIGSPDDLPPVLENNAEGIGLFRTEFLFMKNGGETLPSEDEQFEAYKTVLEAMGERPVIFRTLDAGGDKHIAALKIPEEENPFLGLRAIRYCLRSPDVFKTQIRALLRAAVYGNAKIMLPMVISAEEIDEAKKIIDEVIADAKSKNISVAENVPVGIMIETPAAAVTAKELAKKAAFFSIGSNDLTQYTLAVDRGNEAISDLYNELHPAVLSLIKHVISCADEAGIPVDLCGEMAGNVAYTEKLLDCGLREFSMSAIHILKIKRKIAGL